MRKILAKTAWQTLAAIGFLIVVWACLYLAAGNELLVPSLFACFAEMGALLGSGAFWIALSMSFLRALEAFAISFVFALIFAIVAYLVPSFEKIFAPLASALRSLPVLAVLLILLSVFSAGQAPVAVAFLSLFPMLYTGILAALSGVDKQVIAISRVHGTPLWRKVTRIYLPLSAPYILRESGGALAFSLKLVVSAEVLANTAKSLGGTMQEAKIYAEIPELFALVFATFFVGLLLELAATALASYVQKRMQ